MNRVKVSHLAAAATAVLLASSSGHAAIIDVLRGGDATFSQSIYAAGQVPAYIDSYNITVIGTSAVATPGASLAIPSTGVSAITLPGASAANHEGRLEVTGDGTGLTFAGARLAPGATPRATDGTTAWGIGVAAADLSGANTAATLNTGAVNPQYVRAVQGVDSTHIYVASKNPNGGLEYVTGSGSTAVTTALQTTTDWRDVKVISGQLYGGTGSSSVGTHGFYAIGAGTPVAPTPGNTLLSQAAVDSISSFSIASLGGGTAVYGVGDPSGNKKISKLYSLNGSAVLTTASSTGLSTAAYPGANIEGVVALADPNNAAWVDLFVTSSDGIYFGIDNSGTVSGSIAAITFTKIISTTPDTAFYGAAAVPEPSAMAFLPLTGLLLRRKR